MAKLKRGTVSHYISSQRVAVTVLNVNIIDRITVA